MLLTFQDRFRFGRHCNIGSRQFSPESILPVILLPLMLGTAAINHICTVVICITFPVILCLSYWFCNSFAPRTRIFFAWALFSIIYLWAIFEITVPLLELLPEENFIFRICIFVSIFCFYKTRTKACVNFVKQTVTNDTQHVSANSDQTRLLLDHDDSSDDASQTEKRHRNRRFVPSRPVHCDVCQQFVINRYHHSKWLDCCIGESNVFLFLLGCFLGIFGLLFGANLTLTSICHPFFFFNFFGIQVLLPDDCSDVFDQYDMALSFVGSIYATAIGLCGLLIILKEIYLILRRRTASELKRSFMYLRAYICCYRI